IRDLVGAEVEVSTGWRYEIDGLDRDGADRLARRLLANPVVHAIHHGAHHPESLPKGHRYSLAVREVRLRGLDDAALERLSREAHLFLDLAEMRAIQAQYESLGREPREIELETLAQTWSEHCVHKTLKSVVRYRSDGGQSETAGQRDSETREDPIRWRGRPGHVVNADGSVTINNLLKSTVAAATHELIADGVDWCLSVFEDNAGIIAFDDEHAVCVKVETHNHPSAIEPYGGAATGIGGCIRDILGTGLGAKPIASTDVFCVAFPDGWGETARQRDSETGEDTRTASDSQSPVSLSRSLAVSLPPGCLHPKRVLTEVVAGVRDYGNRMGIPTVSGAVWFDDRHIGNPLVFCGCVGVMPRWAVGGKARAGDRIIALGGRTGRDGIHGATFSSAELTDTHADEFAHAVQIGNAIEEKRVLDVVLRARDWGSDEGLRDAGPAAPFPPSLRRSVASSLFSAITDCGAGGFSSAVGEMGADLGATVHLERAPLKYEGLSATEIWISEAQERMVLSVPPGNWPVLQEICRAENVEATAFGTFRDDGQLVIRYQGSVVGEIDCRILHDGIPKTRREAAWVPSEDFKQSNGSPPNRIAELNRMTG
ncbi:MAG: hypothetical protein KC544_15685, partial [Gemmatimonadetes bacterium]|nr:hypothetical protein [Gemmatimonadota bacterium]